LPSFTQVISDFSRLSEAEKTGLQQALWQNAAKSMSTLDDKKTITTKRPTPTSQPRHAPRPTQVQAADTQRKRFVPQTKKRKTRAHATRDLGGIMVRITQMSKAAAILDANSASCMRMVETIPEIISVFSCKLPDMAEVEYTLNMSRVLKCGSNGLVAFYNRDPEGDKGYPASLCIKMFSSREEFNIVQQLARDYRHCKQASTVPIGSGPYYDRRGTTVYAAVMPEYHGSLFDFVLGNRDEDTQREIKLPPETVRSIINQLYEQLQCLNDVPNYLYQDIKPENVLYHREGDTITVALADFEPLMRTFACPISQQRSRRANEEWCQRFSLVVLIAELTDPYSDLHYNENKEQTGYQFWDYATKDTSSIKYVDQDQFITEAGDYLKSRQYHDYLYLLQYPEDDNDTQYADEEGQEEEEEEYE